MALLLPLIICLQAHTLLPNIITLESEIIKMADGSFIDANRIEFIRKFRRKLITLLLGQELPNGKRLGQYKLDGKIHTICSLTHMEQNLATIQDRKELLRVKQALGELLTQAKADFIVMSKEFMDSGRGSKNIVIKLIEEECQKRNRPNSILLEWAKTKEGQESTMFEQRVTSFVLYCSLCTDLVNFLFDLLHSCPKAEAQFRERVAKWSAVKNILHTVLKKAHIKPDHINETEFLRYLKERYLDHITIDEIDPHVILPLLTEFIKHQTTEHA